jgi:hypothetical protein
MNSISVKTLGSLALVAALVESASVPKRERIAPVGTLHSARAAHTATTLQSGQVLIIGGMGAGGGSLATVELFDPTMNTILELGSLAERRAGHTATLLKDGSVLIAGGFNGEYLRSVELFDASTKRFRRVGALVEARSGHTATLLHDGRVLLVGGVGRGWSFLRSAELYDPETGDSQVVDAMNVQRESHTATLLEDGSVLIIGGHRGRRQQMVVHASAERFLPQARRFEAAGTLATARHKHDAVRLADGRVLVIGGADRSDRVHYATTELYDPENRSFARGPAMASRRYKIAGTTVVLPNGDVLVTSGARSAEILRSGGSKFVEVPGRFPQAYRFAAVAGLRGGDVLIAGGYSDDNRNSAGIWRFSRP